MDKMTDARAVEVLAAMREDGGVVADADYTAAIDHVIARLGGGEAHCATCSCVPGMTPAVRFNTTPAEREGAVRDHLIRMGWTPPAEAQAQGGGEVVPVAWRTVYPDGSHSPWRNGAGHWPKTAGFAGGSHGWEYAFAPPSAPVGVEGLIEEWESDLAEDRQNGIDAALLRLQEVHIKQLSALAQQPAAVDGAMVEVASLPALWMREADEIDRLGHVVNTNSIRARASELERALAAQPGGSDNDR